MPSVYAWEREERRERREERGGEREREKSTGLPQTVVEMNNLPFLLANLSVYTGTDSACGSNRFITFASFHGEDAVNALTVNLLWEVSYILL